MAQALDSDCERRPPRLVDRGGRSLRRQAASGRTGGGVPLLPGSSSSALSEPYGAGPSSPTEYGSLSEPYGAGPSSPTEYGSLSEPYGAGPSSPTEYGSLRDGRLASVTSHPLDARGQVALVSQLPLARVGPPRSRATHSMPAVRAPWSRNFLPRGSTRLGHGAPIPLSPSFRFEEQRGAGFWQASPHLRTLSPPVRAYQAATRCCMGPPRVSTNSAREPENGIFSQRSVWRRTLSPYFVPPR
jgi:hypothetical protein